MSPLHYSIHPFPSPLPLPPPPFPSIIVFALLYTRFPLPLPLHFSALPNLIHPLPFPLQYILPSPFFPFLVPPPHSSLSPSPSSPPVSGNIFIQESLPFRRFLRFPTRCLFRECPLFGLPSLLPLLPLLSFLHFLLPSLPPSYLIPPSLPPSIRSPVSLPSSCFLCLLFSVSVYLSVCRFVSPSRSSVPLSCPAVTPPLPRFPQPHVSVRLSVCPCLAPTPTFNLYPSVPLILLSHSLVSHLLHDLHIPSPPLLYSQLVPLMSFFVTP